MKGNMMEPKGFKIELKTVELTGSGEIASNTTIAEICERIGSILEEFGTFDGKQHVAVTIQTCDSNYEIEDSVINLVSEQSSQRIGGDYRRNYWIEDL